MTLYQLKKYIFILCLVVVPAIGFSVPVIKQVKVTNATCRSNGILEVVGDKTEGNVTYQLVNPSELTTPPQTSPLFTGLPAGSYTVALYDATTGASPVTTVTSLISTYPAFFLNPPSSSTNTSQICGDNGQLGINLTGGRAPYAIKITNTTTSQTWSQQTSSSGYTFTGLPSGEYNVEVVDQCGELRSTVSTTTVNSGGETLKNTPFTTLGVNGGYPSVSGNGGCSKISLYFYYYYILINGTNSLQTTIPQILQYRLEYPAGSGTYTNWSIIYYGAYFYIDNYDPSKLDYNFQVKHPCTGEITSTALKLPVGIVDYSIKYNCVTKYKDFCTLPDSASVTVGINSTGISNYTCGVYPFKVTFTPTAGNGTKTKEYVWSSGTSFTAMDLDLATTYKVTIVDNQGTVLSENKLTVTTLNPTKPLSIQPLVYDDGYYYNCNFNSMILYFTSNTSYCSGYSLAYTGKATFSIVSGPATRDPITVDFSKSYNSFLWSDLPYGVYKIKVSYDCGREETWDISRTQTYKSFNKLTLTPSDGTVCGKYNLNVKPEFFNMSNSSVTAYFTAILYRKNADNTKTQISNITTSSNYIFPNLDGGNYIVEIRPYYYPYSLSSYPWIDKNCVLASAEISFAPYNPPIVNVPLSGGITCVNQSVGTMTITATGDRPPYTYRMKPLNANDSEYTPWQSANVFTNITPAKYTVQVKDNCGSATTQELRVYYGKDQFLYIVGEIAPGVICAGKSTELSVLSIGPVQSYKWYKNNVLINGANGPTYSIPNTSTADIGIYKIVIDNYYCELENTVEIKDVVFTPSTPVIRGVCTDYGATLTAITDDAVSYTWYKDDVVISGATTSTYSATLAGYYTVSAKASGGCISNRSQAYVVAPGTMYWSKTPVDNDWGNKVNWENAAGIKLNVIPTICTDVHIPGNSNKYPDLTSGTNAVCRNIYYHFGGEVAKPHLLSYEKAFVQYNFGYYDAAKNYKVDGDPFSAVPMKRGQWYALAAPLKSMASGDFSFGGRPDIWREGFVRKNVAKDFSGEWLSPANPNALEIGSDQLYAISVWAGSLVGGSIGEDAQYQTNLNQLKGVIEMPYFENPAVSDLHRIHQYSGGKSRFYYYWNLDPMQPVDTRYDEFTRDKKAYRFIFDGKLETAIINSQLVPVFKMTVPAGKEIMIGNPFISNLDFNKFYELNASKLTKYYRLYKDHNWVDFEYNVFSGTLTQYIAPLQAFFIQTTGNPGDADIELLFPPDLVSVVKPDNKLRSSSSELLPENVLYVNVSNSTGNSWMTVAVRDNDDLTGKSPEDIRRLFNFNSQYEDVPQVYAVDYRDWKNSIQFVPTDKKTTVGIGIRSTNKGRFEIQFDNVDHMDVESLHLVDLELNKVQDLFSNNKYVFDNTSGRLENRFQLVVGKQSASTGIEDVNGENSAIQIYSGDRTLYVKSPDTEISSIQVLNAQGMKVIIEPSVNSHNFTKLLSVTPGVYIVMVELKNGRIKVEKMIIK